jgi:retron-type reverse transcriptase
VSWVFEAEIRKFCDSKDHKRLMRMVERQIADPRILRLIGQWLAVGVLENGSGYCSRRSGRDSEGRAGNPFSIDAGRSRVSALPAMRQER